MKSKWKISSNTINGETKYIAYRVLDTDKVAHGGNMEFSGDYLKDRSLVEAIVSQLNDMEAGYA